MTTTNSPIPSVFVIRESLHESPGFVENPTETPVNIEKTVEKHEKRPLTLSPYWKWIRAYVRKFRGLREQRPKRLPWHEYMWTFIGAFLSILTISFIHFRVLEPLQFSFLIGSFGASAAIVFGVPHSPLAQPRNLIGGHIIGAVSGCVARLAIYQFEQSVGCAVAVATAIVVTQLTETAHPPAGATALIAVTARPIMRWANFQFVLMPALTGACTMLIVGLIVNNLAPKRTYPSFWW